MIYGSTKKHRINFIDLREFKNLSQIHEILEQCEAVESRVWNSKENFFEYVKRQSYLIYAEDIKTQEIIGFALFWSDLKNEALLIEASECMILPEHHGNNLPNLFVSVLVSSIRESNTEKGGREYTHIIFMSLTVNYKIMQAFNKYSYLSISSSFSPCPEILQAAEDYIKREKAERVTPESPFFLKQVYTNSLKKAPNINIPQYVPLEFDLARGDGFLYLCKIKKFLFLGFIARCVQWSLGFKRVRP